MNEKSALPEAVTTAVETLGRFETAQEIIRGEALRLSGLLQERLTAEQRVTDAELAPGSDSAKESAELRKAKAALAEVNVRIDETAERLRRWHLKQAGSINELTATHAGALKAWPDFRRQLTEAFRPAWEAAAAEWSRVLGERAALERLLGAPLPLPEPAPIAVELPAELQAPQSVVRDLEQVIAKLAADGRLASAPSVVYQGMAAPPVVGPRDVYVLQRDRDGIPAGTFVVRDSFPEGVLQRMAESKRAVPAVPAAVAKARWDAARALRMIEAAKLEASQAEAAEQKKALDLASDERFRRENPIAWREARRAREEAERETRDQAEHAERYARNQAAAAAASDAEWAERMRRAEERERKRRESAGQSERPGSPITQMLAERDAIERSI